MNNSTILPERLSLEGFRMGLLHWAARFPYCCVLDSCQAVMDRYGEYELLCGVGGETCEQFQSLEELDEAEREQGWLFGVLSYDLKNRMEKVLETRTQATVPFPELGFFQAEIVIAWKKGASAPVVELGNPDQVLEAIFRAKEEPLAKRDQAPDAEKGDTQEPQQNQAATVFSGKHFAPPVFHPVIDRDRYLETIRQLRRHIYDGDCYEINFCQEFRAALEAEQLSLVKEDLPVWLYAALSKVSPVPFAGLFRFGATWLICASPERFLKRKGRKLITQPIKGTAPRGADPESDQQHQEALLQSEKEQAENVMIVDLSRNDLYRSSEVNSVQVPDLFEVQTFPKVHHLVSTVTGIQRQELSTLDVLRNIFPPGSMTGAPKVRVCQLIDQYEPSARGIYAGSLGYFRPDGDFDLNVVIRSLVFDRDTGQLSYHVGGAITWDSDPEKEYEETLIKASAIREIMEKGFSPSK